MKTDHTPGPWTIGDQKTTFYDKAIAEINAPEWTALAGVFIRNGGKSDPEGIANAQLIAAAPELLQNLQAMVTCFERFEDTHTALVMEAARAAIKKATGG